MPLAVLAQRTINALDSVPLLAVPMFIFAAALFNAAGITRHLFDLIRLLVGRIRGGLGHVTVLTNLVFSGISGAALADIGALGGTQIKLMREQGYRDEFAAGITMAAATIGPIFPPSIPLIIFAAAAEVSRGQGADRRRDSGADHRGLADAADRRHGAHARTCRATRSRSS